jgi:glycerol uptake facilitator-like aquaporin
MFFNELFGTFLFVLIILSVTDKRNGTTRPIEVNAAIIGISVGIVSFSFGGNTGSAINPARDFSPRLFTLISGYGTSVFTSSNFYFWIPVFAPLGMYLK